MGRFDTLGSLVSAHRAWRRTLPGGCVSGGRQWAAGGPPRLVCDNFIDVLSLNHHHYRCRTVVNYYGYCWPDVDQSLAMGNINSGCSVYWDESPTESIRGVFVTGQHGNKWRPVVYEAEETQSMGPKPIVEWIQPSKERNIDPQHMIIYCWRDVHMYSEHIQQLTWKWSETTLIFYFDWF